MRKSQGCEIRLARIASSAFVITGLRAIFTLDLQKSVGHWQSEMLLQMLQLVQVGQFEAHGADNRRNVLAGKIVKTCRCTVAHEADTASAGSMAGTWRRWQINTVWRSKWRLMYLNFRCVGVWSEPAEVEHSGLLET